MKKPFEKQIKKEKNAIQKGGAYFIVGVIALSFVANKYPDQEALWGLLINAFFLSLSVYGIFYFKNRPVNENATPYQKLYSIIGIISCVVIGLILLTTTLYGAVNLLTPELIQSE